MVFGVLPLKRHMHAGSVHTPKNCIKKVIFAMCGIGPTQSYLFNRDIFLNFFSLSSHFGAVVRCLSEA